MSESIALPLLLALLTLFGMSFTADNVGDNLGDLILGNGSPVQELIDPFYSQYLREHRFEHVTYDDYLAMLEKCKMVRLLLTICNRLVLMCKNGFPSIPTAL